MTIETIEYLSADHTIRRAQLDQRIAAGVCITCGSPADGKAIDARNAQCTDCRNDRERYESEFCGSEEDLEDIYDELGL